MLHCIFACQSTLFIDWSIAVSQNKPRNTSTFTGASSLSVSASSTVTSNLVCLGTAFTSF